MSIAHRLKVSAEILLFITVIIMVIVAYKVISLGELIGVQILLTSLFFILFMWLGWNYPKPTGVALTTLGSILLIFFSNLAINPKSWSLLGSPVLVSGLLFIGSGWRGRQAM